VAGNTLLQAKGLSALAGTKAAQPGTPCPIKLVTVVMCRAMDKPGSQGVYTSRCLSFGDSWEDPLGKCQGRQPDSGNPTVRDETGGLWKRDAWSDGHLPRSWKRRIQWKLLTYTCARHNSIPTVVADKAAIQRVKVPS
jgi:hypothetical protein